MNGLPKYTILAGALSSMPLQAAEDLGLRLHDTGLGQHGTGIGVSAGLKIKLGADRVVQRSDRNRIGITAGPVHLRASPRAANGIARRENPLFLVETSPGFSTKFSVANNIAFEHRTPLGAGQRNRTQQSREQSTGDKAASVAAVAGVLAILAVGGIAIAASANSD